MYNIIMFIVYLLTLYMFNSNNILYNTDYGFRANVMKISEEKHDIDVTQLNLKIEFLSVTIVYKTKCLT